MGILGLDLGFDFLLERILDWIQGRNETNKTTRSYLNYLINNCSKLGKDWIGEDQSFLLDIARAFVPVQLTGTDGRAQSLKLILGTQGHDRLVIQGQPGAGKSSLSRFITWTMAQAFSDPKRHGSLPREQLSCSPLFPLRVELKECLSKPVSEVLLASVPNIAPEYVERRLTEGKVLILFDGLDEVGDTRHKAEVMRDICKLTDLYYAPDRENRFLVTTRPAGYDHRVLASCNYELYTLGELAPDQQKEMIYRYYSLWCEKRPLVEGERGCTTKANNLIEQLDKMSGMRHLRGSPLLLSQIAKLHFEDKQLPNRRYELYDQCIRELISRRDLPYVPPTAEVDICMSILADLAFAMHKDKGTSTFSRGQVEQILCESLRNHHSNAEIELNSSKLLENMEKRWGLLVNQGDDDSTRSSYSFLYPIFREYLAARAVYYRRDEYWPMLKVNLDDDWWKEVVFLYTAMPCADASQGPSPLDLVLTELLSVGRSRTNRVWIRAAQLLVNEDPMKPSKFHSQIIERLNALSYGEGQASLSALESLCQIKPDGCELVLDRIQKQQSDPLSDSVVTQLKHFTGPIARQNMREAILAEMATCPKPEDRTLWAEALGQVGDTRLGELVDVSPLVTRASHRLVHMGRYPISNSEYAQFVNETGRAAPAHWPHGEYAWQFANHPVTHVSHGDAMAYCEWRSQCTQRTHRLPTEDEWLAVATDNQSGQRYPWGDECDQYRFNWRRYMHGTTPVGIYCDGESSRGIADLLGNVWEWTEEQKEGRYMLKGGAWDSTDLLDEGVEAVRFEPPTTCTDNIGFRVVVETKRLL